ncbi:hypothetical protein LTR16_008514, partial [Cryomyces antarcticus]
MSSLDLGDNISHTQTGDTPYVFIPPDPRAYYRYVLKEALTYDLAVRDLQPPEADTPSTNLLSKQSTELLSEIGLRWRVPQFSRVVLFLDVMREKFQDQETSLEILDTAFTYVKEPQLENKKGNRSSLIVQSSLLDRARWTIKDHALAQQILMALHDALLRELFDLMQHCYENKPPSIGPVMYILENHIYNDPLFAKSPEDLDDFTGQLKKSLHQKARDIYNEYLSKEIPNTETEWEFFHVVQLGKAI